MEKPIETEYHGIIDYKGLIAHYGLNNSDVEWYGRMNQIKYNNESNGYKVKQDAAY
ncbi:hypothetical protein [Bacteroides acidifaciens]|uniref:hypothetical protein n=1 Tax=Bacteroides acidifaciens TaxID=85831 RepID=UPI000A9F7CE8|nr:hypothetical protein [Bacteroides acidifaciens]MCR1997480.1 hypothetical protein [Bacteroides acidifaciens]